MVTVLQPVIRLFVCQHKFFNKTIPVVMWHNGRQHVTITPLQSLTLANRTRVRHVGLRIQTHTNPPDFASGPFKRLAEHLYGTNNVMNSMYHRIWAANNTNGGIFDIEVGKFQWLFSLDIFCQCWWLTLNLLHYPLSSISCKIKKKNYIYLNI